MDLIALDRKPTLLKNQSPGPSRGHDRLDSLDGLRGIAILMVLMTHFSGVLLYRGTEGAIHAWFDFGNTGVDLFLGLSGFLITRILVRTRDDPGYFRKFYWRRALRVFPLYYAFLVFIALPYRWFSFKMMHRDLQAETNIFSFIVYIDNLIPNYGVEPWVSHMWSLAIEEQFYLVWPLVVFLTPRRTLIPVCLVGAVGSLAFRSWLISAHFEYEAIHRLTPARLDTLLLGAAVGIIHLDARLRGRAVKLVWPVAGACGLVALALAATGGLRATTGSLGADYRPAVVSIGWTAVAVFYAAVVLWAATVGLSNRVLTSGFLRALGKYSYGLYVLHFIALPILRRGIGTDSLGQRLAVIAAASVAAYGLAWLSFNLFEAPFLKLKDRFAYQRPIERPGDAG